MPSCDRCLNGCGGARTDCPLAEWQYESNGRSGPAPNYTREIGDRICMLLADGVPVRHIAKMPGMPTRGTIKNWVTRDHDGFAARYQRAYRLGLDEMADELLEIADDGARDYKAGPDGREVPDHDHIQRSKLRVDTRKWLLSKRLPKEFGDRIDVNASIKRSPSEFSDEELEAIAAGRGQGASSAEED